MEQQQQGSDERIAAEAMSRPAQERSAFLETACYGNQQLRDRVNEIVTRLEEKTLGHEPSTADRPAGLLDGGKMGEALGTKIGHYKLLQIIGEGGFGSVYMAEQLHPVRRKVALKIIKLGMDTRQVIARFEAERQALAMMDHPNIAKVLDAGATETGRPYFVMELVKGVPITQYCDTNNVSTRERLDLFVQVCRAVQHAHQKGIIHRDIKPTNILVTMADGIPIPKVIDFGIAKATQNPLTDKTLFTEYRALVGTPEYMSPEQAEMAGIDIDTRSDIYSLGVLLYELLTGTTPFDAKELRSKGAPEIQRMIREIDPPKPSTRLSSLATVVEVAQHRSTDPVKLNRMIRGELDWIVMRCLEKDRTRRYETANALATDITKYLKDEPISAGPPGATYALRKLARRYKWPLAMAG
ncbi:MAG TPA: serine/threonine-protein kinase, partial [Tepidisphaeraceae bacterium]|nr:serine/threonine-protein kinase [Tepidisphaeraceae bacterium]